MYCDQSTNKPIGIIPSPGSSAGKEIIPKGMGIWLTSRQVLLISPTKLHKR